MPFEGLIGPWLAEKILNCIWDKAKKAARQPRLLEAFENACKKAASENKEMFSKYSLKELGSSARIPEGENLAIRLQELFENMKFPSEIRLKEMLMDS